MPSLAWSITVFNFRKARLLSLTFSLLVYKSVKFQLRKIPAFQVPVSVAWFGKTRWLGISTFTLPPALRVGKKLLFASLEPITACSFLTDSPLSSALFLSAWSRYCSKALLRCSTGGSASGTSTSVFVSKPVSTHKLYFSKFWVFSISNKLACRLVTASSNFSKSLPSKIPCCTKFSASFCWLVSRAKLAFIILLDCLTTKRLYHSVAML